MIDRLPFSEIAIVDDQGALTRRRRRPQSLLQRDLLPIHENLNVPMPEGRTAVG
jgi:hypothetical protein